MLNKILNFRFLIVVPFLYLISLSSCFNSYPVTTVEANDQRIVVHFTRTASQSLLDSIQSICRAKGIQLEYILIKKDGELLSKLEFDLQYQNKRGFAKTNFVNLRAKHFGFEIDFSPNGKFRFGDL